MFEASNQHRRTVNRGGGAAARRAAAAANGIVYRTVAAAARAVCALFGGSASDTLASDARRIAEAQHVARIGHWEYDLRSRIVWWSDEKFRLFGLAPGEEAPTRELFFSFLHPEDADHVIATIDHAARAGQPYDIDFRIVRRDGTVAVINEQADVASDRRGVPVRLIGTVQEITQRKAVEDALRSKEAAYRSLFENSAAGACETDAHTGQFLRVNRRMCEITGYTPDELLARTFRDITHPDDIEQNAEDWREFVAGELPEYAVEKRYVRKDGVATWVRACAARVRPGDGRDVSSIVAVVMDINDRKRIEEAQHQTEQRLRRQNEALVMLAQQPWGDDIGQAVRRITEVAARTLDVARCGLWLYTDNRESLRCMDAFDVRTGDHTCGVQVRKADYPDYFAAVESHGTIVATDARRDPRTRAFATSYLEPNGVGALLDSPIRVNGQALGILCVEHAGTPRQWTADEEGFADSVGTLVAVAIESCERARVQAALTASEERFRAFMDHSPVAAFLKDEDGRLLYVNATFERAFGITREKSVGQRDLDLWPEFAPTFREHDRRVRESGRSMEFIEPVPDGEGMLRQFLSFKFPMAGNGPGARLVGGICVDLTERYAAQEASAKLASIVEGSEDAIVSVNRDGTITSWNAGAERMFGYTPAEAMGHSVRMLMPFQRADEWKLHMERAATGQRVRHVETVRRAKDGRLIDISLSAAPTFDSNGAIVGAAGILRDISDRKRFEAALAESERFARSTVDALTDHIAIIDGSGEILAVNLAWREFAVANGLHAAQYGLGSDYLAACDSGGLEGALAAEGIRSILRGERDRFDLEYACPSSDAERWFAMRVTRFSGEGSIRLVVCHENITERKRNEALQREQGSLRGAVSAMEQVLGVVGHELRTPLAGLRAMSEYLLTDGARGTEEATQFLAAMNQEVVRMGDTVDQLLEAARLNSGRAKWNWSEFPLRQVCEDALDTVRPLVDAARVRVACDVEPADVAMSGDAEAIRRLVLNLAGNSRKHTTDGEIRVDVRAAADPGAVGARWVEIRVSDTGEGIAPEIVSRLGEAFALNSGIVGAQHVSGTGLGLAICKAIAAAHGGIVAIESTLGRGTTMTVRLRADLSGPACGGGKNLVLSTHDVTAPDCRSATEYSS
jgi:PAS domain S-box-containing protein